MVKFRPHLACQMGTDQKRRDAALTLLQGNAGILAPKYCCDVLSGRGSGRDNYVKFRKTHFSAVGQLGDTHGFELAGKTII